MFSPELFISFLWSAAAGLLTLLGSTGIFVSLVVQRRIERLQSILEEFLELPYSENKNLAGPMVHLVRKYQMHYLFPNRPGRTILLYLDFTLMLIAFLWLTILSLSFQWPIDPFFVFQCFLMALIAGNVYLFRRLLQQTISPTGNPLFNPIIPPPYRLRSVSYLSRYVNVSVKSVLQQARFALSITADGEFRLKQELSFDDFYYFLYCKEKNFLAWGELRFNFPPDPITKKPTPLQRNMEIPLGRLTEPALEVNQEPLLMTFYIFPQGEKHPVQYDFILHKEDEGYHSRPFPEMTVQSSLVFQVKQSQLYILEGAKMLPYHDLYESTYLWNGQRYYSEKPAEGKPCRCEAPPEVC
ncbi:hypothetical protein F9B85_08755 [Heliorestis acidaminivorans]|uniref:Uncharacterized protein n=1 Tax=Heliorestis acidaminivorans TaxID=553427 RepID=A0A6I0F621_9FIRM|nr:hypothetical protein [Heliorestis acidaminivorans]KAB2952729.1 hypothetical protein F9B85_08755 [Heliorestis acidaminivorans]